ncbi:F-box/FBD/LRR-repeat protein At1g13570-like [Bidens hawaiensis]|uniref:F-box/FBD/LRR-repeat protein At1g13570-like n=1 Tax=Bidens hawaiensis TaxID=980011 RepID=UPI00404A7122
MAAQNASYYALASQNILLQQMLTMDNEIGSHNKCPKLLKLSDFARWEPRFRAHLDPCILIVSGNNSSGGDKSKSAVSGDQDKSSDIQALVVTEVVDWSQRLLGNQANVAIVESVEKIEDASSDNLSEGSNLSDSETDTDQSLSSQTESISVKAESYACMAKIDDVCFQSQSNVSEPSSNVNDCAEFACLPNPRFSLVDVNDSPNVSETPNDVSDSSDDADYMDSSSVMVDEAQETTEPILISDVSTTVSVDTAEENITNLSDNVSVPTNPSLRIHSQHPQDQIIGDLGMVAKCLRSDRISNLPSSIIETILSLLPFKEAARTSILAREWRYYWTKYPKLEFAANQVNFFSFDDAIEECMNQEDRKIVNAINQVMSIHRGPIQEFSLSMYALGPCVEVDRIIDNLPRNYSTLKKLTLGMCGYCLPKSIFSLYNLTDLYLHHCHLDVPPTFSGFGSLANLYLENVIITKKMLLLFLSTCPLLKTVVLIPYLESLPDIDDFTVIELFECLPMIETLTIDLLMLEHFAPGRVPNKLPAALVHLKYLCITDTPSYGIYRIPCYAFLIRSSPNLEKLKLMIYPDLYFGRLDKAESYSDMWLEHLNELEIEICSWRKNRLDLVKLILAKSPVLKKVKILLWYNVTKDEELEFSEMFLRSPCASPVIEVTVERV